MVSTARVEKSIIESGERNKCGTAEIDRGHCERRQLRFRRGVKAFTEMRIWYIR
jgi:hypothetical protein